MANRLKRLLTLLAQCAATIGVSHFLPSLAYRNGKISEVSDVSSKLLFGASKCMVWGGVPTDIIPIVEKILAISTRQHAVAPPQEVTQRFLYTSPCTILQRMMMAVVLKTSFTFLMLFKWIFLV